MLHRLLVGLIIIIIMNLVTSRYVVSIANSALAIYTVPMFHDNYGFVIIDKKSQNAALIDPGDGPTINSALNAMKNDGVQFKLSQIWCTHKHNDHIGGNNFFRELYKNNLKIIGPKNEEIPCIDEKVGDKSIIEFGQLKVQVFETPCHTKGHINYYIDDDGANNKPIIFTGDTLFRGGSGRFFEGNGLDMLLNMDKYAKLKPNTLVYCAHEYTESNYKFLASIDPKLNKKYEEIKVMRSNGVITIPSTIEEEKKFNLFMRCRDPEVQAMVSCDDPVATITKLRELKNNFR